jgi:hypothetical protein
VKLVWLFRGQPFCHATFTHARAKAAHALQSCIQAKKTMAGHSRFSDLLMHA